MNPDGRRELLWARFEVEKAQHEYEVTAVILAARPKAVRRGHQVGKFRSDAELLYGEVGQEQIVYLELERTRKSLDRVKDRIRQYDGCNSTVCWIVQTDARIKNIIRTCNPPRNHMFSTLEQAIADWNNPAIWQQNSQEMQ